MFIFDFVAETVLDPVSYTHLDVYKRQGKDMPQDMSRTIRDLRHPWTMGISMAGCVFCLDWKRDVYKRQRQGRGRDQKRNAAGSRGGRLQPARKCVKEHHGGGREISCLLYTSRQCIRDGKVWGGHRRTGGVE